MMIMSMFQNVVKLKGYKVLQVPSIFQHIWCEEYLLFIMFVIKPYFLWRTDLGFAFMCFTVYLGQTAHGSE